MTVYTERLPNTKTEKSWYVRWTPVGDAFSFTCGTVVIESRKTHVEYVLSEFPCGFPGRGFHLVKVVGGTDAESEAYDVFVPKCGTGHTCDCKGFAYGRGKPCKHVEAVLALIENGWL